MGLNNETDEVSVHKFYRAESWVRKPWYEKAATNYTAWCKIDIHSLHAHLINYYTLTSLFPDTSQGHQFLKKADTMKAHHIVAILLNFFSHIYLTTDCFLGSNWQGWKKSWCFKNQILKSDFFYFFFKFVFSHQGFTKFSKLVSLLNHINNMAAMLLLFPVTLLLSKK